MRLGAGAADSCAGVAVETLGLLSFLSSQAMPACLHAAAGVLLAVRCWLSCSSWRHHWGCSSCCVTPWQREWGQS